MGRIILDFPLPVVKREGDKIWVELGNGVRLITTVPEWAGEVVKSATLQLVLDVEGSPPDGEPSSTPKQ